MLPGTMSTELQATPKAVPARCFLDEYEGLTPKQKLLADHWLITQNGTESAKVAGYTGTDEVLAITASRTLRLSKVSAYIKKRLRRSLMGADEVLQRLSEQGRSDITDIVSDSGEISIKDAKSKGVSHLIKKLKTRTRTDKDGAVTVEHDVEMYSAQSALELMAKHHKLLTDRVESENSQLSAADIARIGEQLLASMVEAAARKRAEQAQLPPAPGHIDITPAEHVKPVDTTS